MPIKEFSRDEWLETKFDYRPGQSAMIIGPTGGGKTYMAWQMAEAALEQNPQLDFTVLQPKPADETTMNNVTKYGLKISQDYPFHKKFWESKPNGWVHWPAHIRNDEDKNSEHLHTQFSNSLGGEYWSGNKLVLIDDTYLIGAQLKCNKLLDKYLIAGRSNDAGIIGCLQQASGTVHGGSIGSFAYSQPAHLLFTHETGKAPLEKLGSIGMGMDSNMLADVVKNLQTYTVNDALVSEMLHLDRRGYVHIVHPW